MAALFADAGVVAVVPLVSPYRSARDAVRRRVEGAGLSFVEVFVDTPLEICEARDPKGLYAKARAGELRGMTGIDDPYEPPEHPDLVLVPADGLPPEQAAHRHRPALSAARRGAQRRQRLVLDPVRLGGVGAQLLLPQDLVLAEVALEPAHLRIALERQDVGGDPIEEPPVVAR